MLLEVDVPLEVYVSLEVYVVVVTYVTGYGVTVGTGCSTAVFPSTVTGSYFFWSCVYCVIFPKTAEVRLVTVVIVLFTISSFLS